MQAVVVGRYLLKISVLHPVQDYYVAVAHLCIGQYAVYIHCLRFASFDVKFCIEHSLAVHASRLHVWEHRRVHIVGIIARRTLYLCHHVDVVGRHGAVADNHRGRRQCQHHLAGRKLGDGQGHHVQHLLVGGDECQLVVAGYVGYADAELEVHAVAAHKSYAFRQRHGHGAVIIAVFVIIGRVVVIVHGTLLGYHHHYFSVVFRPVVGQRAGHFYLFRCVGFALQRHVAHLEVIFHRLRVAECYCAVLSHSGCQAVEVVAHRRPHLIPLVRGIGAAGRCHSVGAGRRGEVCQLHAVGLDGLVRLELGFLPSGDVCHLAVGVRHLQSHGHVCKHGRGILVAAAENYRRCVCGFLGVGVEAFVAVHQRFHCPAHVGTAVRQDVLQAVVAALKAAGALLHGVEGLQQEIAVAHSAPTPVDVEVTVAVAVADEGVAAFI